MTQQNLLNMLFVGPILTLLCSVFFLYQLRKTRKATEFYSDTRQNTKMELPVKIIVSIASPRERNRLFILQPLFTIQIVILKSKLC